MIPKGLNFGTEISSSAKVCHNCGKKQVRQRVRRSGKGIEAIVG